VWGPLQYLRELTQNSIQANKETPEGGGEIIWDYYQPEFDYSGVKKLCIIDTGVGMSGREMVKYINSALPSYERSRMS
jgi:HSP90 family molecular chaperone